MDGDDVMEVHVRFFLDSSPTECICCDGEGFHKYAFRKDIVTHTDDFFFGVTKPLFSGSTLPKESE